jgi:predicted phosphodiesterase
MRLAFLADIHGNLPAFDAVRADLAMQSPDAVYLAGDQINRCPWNNQVMDLIDDLGWPAIQGNHELVVGAINTPDNWDPFTKRYRFPILWWTQEHMDPRHLHTIRTLPPAMHIVIDGAPPIFMVHGVPGNPHVGFYPAIPDTEIEALLEDVDEPLVICAHTHRPLDRASGRWRILNAGSVGLAYNGDPRAQYLLLDLVDGPHGPAWRPTFRQAIYDHSVIPPAYRASGMQQAGGPIADLALRTLMSGDPWSSDFGVWLRRWPAERKPKTGDEMAAAVRAYLRDHGPGRWAFDEPES